ncbi:MAG: thiol reductant ABC exporter subunit CydD [Wenzhouxiangellaceae bacterium]|nr:thiol reductant ABC exporter subunit CydD [Wenzhouxiangellaceae bacterium]
MRERAPGWWPRASFALALAEALVLVAQAWALASIAAGLIIEARPSADLQPLLLLLLGALLARVLITTLRRWLAADASVRVRQQLRAELMRAMTVAGPTAFAAAGERVPVVDEQVETLDRYYTGFLPQSIAARVIPAVVLVFVFSNDWLAGALLALTAPIIPLFMVLAGLGAEQAAARQQAQLTRLGGWFLDRVRGSATLRLFGAEARTEAAVKSRTENLRQATMKVLRIAFLSSAVLEFFAAVAIASIAIYVGLGLFGAIEFGPAPALTLQSGLFVLLLAPEFFQPLRGLSQAWHDRADARAGAAAIREVLELPPARPTADPACNPEPGPSANIELRQLGFAWPGQGRLFDDLELVIPAGQRLVLTGPSGGGKSTLLALLAGFASPASGEIRFDGLRFETFSEAARAAHVAWLGQRPWLFEGSIADNIALGDPEAGRARIEQAAERAQVLEFARLLPDGLDSVVGENGVGLSGGQAQRVALARALLVPRPLLLLDEPTASLDAAGEAEVLAALDGVLRDTPATVVCASHRAGVMGWAERVIEVDGGRLREMSR